MQSLLNINLELLLMRIVDLPRDVVVGVGAQFVSSVVVVGFARHQRLGDSVTRGCFRYGGVPQVHQERLLVDYFRTCNDN